MKKLTIEKLVFRNAGYKSLPVALKDNWGHHAATQLGDKPLQMNCVVERYGHIRLEALGMKSWIVDMNGDDPSDLFFLQGSRLYYQESFWRGTNFIADLETGKHGRAFIDDDGIDGHAAALIQMTMKDHTLYVDFLSA